MSDLFGKSPALPAPAAVQPMPDLNDPAILATKQQQLAQAGNAGRLSTVLTGGSGPSYSAAKLGSQ